MPSTGSPARAAGTTCGHHRGEPGDRAAAQVIAVREAAGQDHRVNAVQVAVGVPQRDRLSPRVPDGAGSVLVIKRTWERDNAYSHAVQVTCSLTPGGRPPCRPPGKGGRPPFTPSPGERAQTARPRASHLPGRGRPPCRPRARQRGRDPLSPPPRGNEHKPPAPGPPTYRPGTPPVDPPATGAAPFTPSPRERAQTARPRASHLPGRGRPLSTPKATAPEASLHDRSKPGLESRFRHTIKQLGGLTGGRRLQRSPGSHA